MQFYKISSEQRVDLPLHQSFLSFWAKLFIMHMIGHMIGWDIFLTLWRTGIAGTISIVSDLEVLSDPGLS